MNDIDALQWPDHYFELKDLAVRIPFDHVDAIDDDTVDLRFKLEYRIALPDDLANIPETVISKNVQCRGEIHRRDRFSDLRSVDDR